MFLSVKRAKVKWKKKKKKSTFVRSLCCTRHDMKATITELKKSSRIHTWGGSGSVPEGVCRGDGCVSGAGAVM